MADPALKAQIESLVGQEIDGRYVIDAVIGHGGMGVVYRGRHLIMQSPVAIKMILGSAEEEDIARFRREAKAVGILKHPDIISVKDLGICRERSPYMILELVEGQGLDKILQELEHS